MKEVFEKIRERLEGIDCDDKWCGDCCHCYREEAIRKAIEIVNQVEEEYKDKYVSLGTYQQVAWERDIAIEQLHDLGYEFGQKIDVPETNVGKNGGWIPCSERLPERNDDVNVTIVVKGETKTVPAYYSSGDWFVWREDNTLFLATRHEIIAWQPLPAPYKPKGEW